jgi:hypothetical protein
LKLIKEKKEEKKGIYLIYIACRKVKKKKKKGAVFAARMQDYIFTLIRLN